ncbi:MAG: DUF5947 family protein [Gammaproteobacteria bacterium]
MLLSQHDVIRHCDICGWFLSVDHAHLIDPASRELLCACPACVAALAEFEDSSLHHISSGVHCLTDFQMTDEQWSALMIPTGFAFFLRSTPSGGVVAMYPGPEGLSESPVRLATWKAVMDSNPMLETLQPDTEALLVHRMSSPHGYYRVPIDRCHALAGLIKKHWRGQSGGSVVHASVARFFTELRNVANVSPRGHYQA